MTPGYIIDSLINLSYLFIDSFILYSFAFIDIFWVNNVSDTLVLNLYKFAIFWWILLSEDTKVDNSIILLFIASKLISNLWIFVNMFEFMISYFEFSFF